MNTHVSRETARPSAVAHFHEKNKNKYKSCSPGRRTKATVKKRACRPALGRLAPPHGRGGRETGENCGGVRPAGTGKRGDKPGHADVRLSALRSVPIVRAQHKPLCCSGQFYPPAPNCFIISNYKTLSA